MRKIIIIIFSFYLFATPCIGQSHGVLLQAGVTIPAVEVVVDTTQSKADKAVNKVEDAANEALDTPKQILNKLNFKNIFWSIVVLVLTYFFLKLVGLILSGFAERSTNYRIRFKGVIPIINIVVWGMAIYLIIAGIFRPQISTIVAAAASIGLAVGFASQDILKNIFAGIVILLDRPFQVGDKIEVDGHYGEVMQIGLRSTRIVTPDDSMVTLPNADCMSKAVSNANSGEPNCQVVAEIFLPMDVDTIKTRKIALEAAQTSKYIYLNKPVTILFLNEVKDHRIYMKMRIKAYVADIRNEFKFKSDMTEIVIRGMLNENLLKPSDMVN